jgi:hypothetical protein
VATGSRQENASNRIWSPVSMETEKALAGPAAAHPKRPHRMGLCSEVADDGEKSGGSTPSSQLIRQPQVLVSTPGSL